MFALSASREFRPADDAAQKIVLPSDCALVAIERRFITFAISEDRGSDFWPQKIVVLRLLASHERSDRMVQRLQHRDSAVIFARLLQLLLVKTRLICASTRRTAATGVYKSARRVEGEHLFCRFNSPAAKLSSPARCRYEL